MSQNTLTVLSAFEQKPIKDLPILEEDEVFAILDKSSSLFKDKKNWLSTVERIKILENVISLMTDQRMELANQAALEGGKPLKDSIVEVDRAIDGVKVTITELVTLKGSEVPMGITESSSSRMAYTKRFPKGVVLAISAFNHPLNLIIHQVIPAVAAGCPVIVKPASTTPLSCKSLVEILYKAGLPKDWCQMIICENDVAQKVVEDSRISFMTFIGSAKVGWFLRSRLAAGASCALEHGGVAPAIVDETADLDKAVPLLVKGGFYHAGQVCVSVQRIIAHESIAEELCKRLTSAVGKLKVGDPNQADTDVGPLILPREVERVSSWVDAAVSEGATLLTGGKKFSDTCYEPTLLLNPSKESEVSKSEIFGPVACVYTYKNIDEAIDFANSLDFAFQASVFTENLSTSLKVIEEVDAMAVMVNDHTAFRVDWMPFGGYKKSGLGMGGIEHSLKDVTIEKMFVIKK